MTSTEISKRFEEAGFDEYEIDYDKCTVTIHFQESDKNAEGTNSNILPNVPCDDGLQQEG
jgi:hypothetical protein